MWRIEGVDIYRVRMPLVSPFNTAFGNTTEIESVFLRIYNGQDYGWGESAPWEFPCYSPESAAGVFVHLKKFLVPHILGKSYESAEQLQAELSCFKGNSFAKAAIDLAWWDLQSKKMGQPLWKLIGGVNEVVEVGADFGAMETIDDLLQEIGQAADNGYKRIKLKYRPGWELDMVSSVRIAFPNTVFHVDCNSAYTLRDLEMFKELDQYDLAMIEQPLMHDDLVDHAQLQSELTTPICLDESITSPYKARQAIEMGACKVINIKPGRVGGITPAIKIHDCCLANKIPCWIGGMLESALGASFCVALASLPGIGYPNDIFPSKRFYDEDLSKPEIVLTGPSVISLPQSTGVGAEPDTDLLEINSIENFSVDLNYNFS